MEYPNSSCVLFHLSIHLLLLAVRLSISFLFLSFSSGFVWQVFEHASAFERVLQRQGVPAVVRGHMVRGKKEAAAAAASNKQTTILIGQG
jgi:hypothetical protein